MTLQEKFNILKTIYIGGVPESPYAIATGQGLNGGVAEWLKAPFSKNGIRFKADPEFESLPHRQDNLVSDDPITYKNTIYFDGIFCLTLACNCDNIFV